MNMITFYIEFNFFLLNLNQQNKIRTGNKLSLHFIRYFLWNWWDTILYEYKFLFSLEYALLNAIRWKKEKKIRIFFFVKKKLTVHQFEKLLTEKKNMLGSFFLWTETAQING